MKHFLIAVMLLLNVQFIMAQQTINGLVTDDTGLPVPGVTVTVKGFAKGTITDLNGEYSISVPEGGTMLVFKSMGYKTQEVYISGKTKIDIVLETDTQNIGEVVVIGYGTQKKSDVTGAVTSVKMENVSNQAVDNATKMIQGNASGVFVTQNSGAPGSGLSVRIRGTGTVNNSSPLYVVDGILLDNINHINPSDIATLDILKDASASAIYGSRGANGVILITTKTGKTKDVAVNADVSYGFQQAWKKPDLLNSSDWVQIYNASQAAARAMTGNSAYADLNLLSPSNNVGHTTNWFDEVTRVGTSFKTNVSISKGDEKSNTYFSLGYYDNQGIVLNSKYERLNARLNANYKLSRMFKTGVNLSLSNSKTNNVSSSAISGILTLAQRLDPLTPVKDAQGKWASTPYSDLRNPVAALNRETHNRQSLLLLANAYLEFTPIENLVFRSAISLNLSRSKSKNYLPAYSYVGGENRPVNELTKGQQEFNGWLSENTVTYNLNVSDHHATIMAGFTSEQNVYEFLTAKRNNIPDDIEELQFLSASTDLESTEAWNGGTDIRMFSYIGRLNYNFANRYFLTATIRRDGSSVFGPDNRFGVFPSASLGWKLSSEKFMDFLSKDIFTNIMLRAGWGQVGNAKIAPYGFTSTLQSKDNRLEYSYVFGGKEYAGLAPVKMSNTQTKWEAVESTNFGIDLSLLNDKISFTFDYFIKETKDMLVSVPLPTYGGYDGSPIINAGSVSNKGFEINLAYHGSIANDFKYNVSANFTHIKNEVTSLGGGQPIFGGYVSLIGSTTRTAEGHPIGGFYGYMIDGVFQTQAEVDASAQKGENVGPGDFRFVDQWTDADNDGVLEEPDGVINSNDRVYIGNPIPDFYYGFNIDFTYHGFDFSAFFQGIYGNELFNAFKYYNYDVSKKYAMAADYKDHWTPANKSNSMFGLNTITATAKRNLRTSNFYIEDGSYLRLKNIQIGYTFTNLTEWLPSIRIYFSGQNLLTLTKYSGLDPEVGGGTLNQGVDYSTYPQARIFSFGANINF